MLCFVLAILFSLKIFQVEEEEGIRRRIRGNKQRRGQKKQGKIGVSQGITVTKVVKSQSKIVLFSFPFKEARVPGLSQIAMQS